ncbi:class I SAM-dependent methyltransferase [Paenibacillus glycinis]|uniref:Methyltransferase domain-containing protein n=1 Tax=Paenibacillus glycinis TaxID=2697035 RepID=A0ABW9XRP6_9BACL|nr:class I SAM-dependent methyltransferase [Paenibacillus glycinis]NBD25340.1 methyltransferase domain-containing protein [Paenibacillus glycinis]
MEIMDYKSFYEQAGARNGWDFGNVRVESEGEAWNYAREVASRCGATDALLDIGTGGGELLLGLSGAARALVGIDRAASMVETAKRNAARAGAGNVRFLRMDSDRLRFPDGSFDIVCCRHAPFRASEIARVLMPGGVFMTQQVGEGDKRNLAQAFGRGQHDGASPGAMLRGNLAALRAAGFSELQSSLYDATEYYATPQDLIFLLKHAPIIPDFGEQEEDFAILRRFAAEYGTERGIRTNSERSLIIARKPI